VQVDLISNSPDVAVESIMLRCPALPVVEHPGNPVHPAHKNLKDIPVFSKWPILQKKF
jgi:hypothetical protein